MLTDEDLQARLTAAFREQAGPVASGNVRTAGLYRRAVRSRRRRRATVGVVSAAAAAAVALVVAAGPWAGPGRPAASRPTAGLPKYYVSVDKTRPVAEIHASLTGRVLGRVALPAGSNGNADSIIAAAADDRTFVLALTTPLRFYQLSIAPDGRSGRLSQLRVPPLAGAQSVGGMALTPDGRMLAVTVPTGPPRPWVVEIVSLATGTVRTWSSPGGQPGALSWADGGRELAFFWDSPTGRSAPGLRLLDAAGPGHSLLAAPLILPQQLGKYRVQSAVITPDGQSVIASVTISNLRRLRLDTITGRLIELPVRATVSPRTLLVLHPQRSDARLSLGACTIASVDASGEHILAQCDHFGRIDHGAFTPLPGGSAARASAAAAW